MSRLQLDSIRAGLSEMFFPLDGEGGSDTISCWPFSRVQ